MSYQKFLGIAVVSLLGLCLLFPASLLAQEACEGYQPRHQITKLGGPNAFSPVGASTATELGDLYEGDLRADLDALFAAQGLEGLSDRLIQEIRGTQVDDVTVEPGEEVLWMAYRKRGKEAQTTDARCWKGTKKESTFPAFSFKVPFKGQAYTFLVPKVCANIALTRAEPLPKAVCQVQVSCEEMLISLSSEGSSPGAAVTMTGPTGTESLDASANSWTRDARTRGASYEFSVSVASDNENYSEGCSAEASLSHEAVETCLPPLPSVTFVPDVYEVKAGDPVDVGLEGNWDRLETSAVNEDGEAVAIPGTLPGILTFEDPGVYTLSAVALNALDEEADDTAEVTVKRPIWFTARVFGAQIAPDGDHANQSFMRTDGLEERRSTRLAKGFGAGVNFEIHFNDRVGLDLGIMKGSMEDHFMVDIADYWGMDEKNLDFFTVQLGPNFHLTPDTPVDLYVGPFIALMNYDNVSFDLGGERYNHNVGDETTFGAQIGLDVPFGDSPVGLHAIVRYMDSTAEFSAAPDFNIDTSPFIYGVGLSFSF